MEDDILIYAENYLPELVKKINSNHQSAGIQVYMLIRFGNRTLGELHHLLCKYGYHGSIADLLILYDAGNKLFK